MATTGHRGEEVAEDLLAAETVAEVAIVTPVAAMDTVRPTTTSTRVTVMEGPSRTCIPATDIGRPMTTCIQAMVAHPIILGEDMAP